MKKIRCLFIALLLLLGFACTALPATAFAEIPTDQPHRIVRVGFFPFEGYYAVNSNGQRSGYGYELMQLLALHANWSYEYIDTVQTWSELEQMLLDGQIDMLTSVQKTTANQYRFAFSSLPISTSSTLLTVRSGNTAFIAGDYSTYDGARVGMMRNNSHNGDLDRLAGEKGFSFTPVYFDSLPALLQALQEGTSIDAAVTSSLRPIHNEWILEQFAPAPFYLIVRRDDFTLQQEMDNSLRQLSAYSPDWQTDLYHKYYTPNTGDSLFLSAEERSYMQELKRQNRSFKVAVNPDNAPYSYFKNGQAQGIIPEIFAETARRAGISYEVIVTSSRREYEELIRSGAVDLVMDAFHDYAQAEQLGYKLSKPYIDLSGAFLVRRNSNGWLQTIAIPETMQVQSLHRDHLLDGRETQTVPSTDAAVQAVLNGTCDGAFLYMFTAQKYIHDDEQGRLQLSLIPKLQASFGIAAAQNLDYRLLSILSKSAESVQANYARHIILKYTTLAQAPMSLQRYLHENPLPALGILAPLPFSSFLVS